MLHNHNDFNAGDKVKVVDPDSCNFEKTGIVKERKRYVIVIEMEGETKAFMAHELMKEGK